MIAIVFMVAGMSSRFGGKLKQLAKIGPNNETLIEYSVNQALTSKKIKQIIFITNTKTKHLFVDLFKSEYMNIPVAYIDQTYDRNVRLRPWGSADAVSMLVNFPCDSFIICNGDDIYGEKAFSIASAKIENGNIFLGYKLINTLPDKGKVNRGYVKVKNEKVVEIKEVLGIEKNNYDSELLEQICNVNFIGLYPDVIKKLKKIVSEFKKINKNDPKIECFLPDCLNLLIQKGEMTMDAHYIQANV